MYYNSCNFINSYILISCTVWDKEIVLFVNHNCIFFFVGLLVEVYFYVMIQCIVHSLTLWTSLVLVCLPATTHNYYDSCHCDSCQCFVPTFTQLNNYKIHVTSNIQNNNLFPFDIGTATPNVELSDQLLIDKCAEWMYNRPIFCSTFRSFS